jgi:phage-related protein
VKLLRLAKGRWEVLAVLDARDRCEILDFLLMPEESYRAAAISMLTLLFEIVPSSGPPTAEPLCKSLGGGLYEFRKQPKGKKLRVLWFYGEGAVVCVSAFTKAERTPRSRLAQAAALREWYRAARARGKIEVVELEEAAWKTWKKPRP